MKSIRGAAARRSKVIDAARQLFAKRGFHATGIAQIAQASGVAVGQIYRDFETKEDIVAIIAAASCAAFTADDQLILAIAKKDREATRGWIRQLVDPATKAEHGRLFHEVIAEATRNERIADIFKSFHRDLRAKLIAALGVFAGGTQKADRHNELADTILVISLGLLHHREILWDPAGASPFDRLEKIIDREIDRLELAG